MCVSQPTIPTTVCEEALHTAAALPCQGWFPSDTDPKLQLCTRGLQVPRITTGTTEPATCHGKEQTESTQLAVPTVARNRRAALLRCLCTPACLVRVQALVPNPVNSERHTRAVEVSRFSGLFHHLPSCTAHESF